MGKKSETWVVISKITLASPDQEGQELSMCSNVNKCKGSQPAPREEAMQTTEQRRYPENC